MQTLDYAKTIAKGNAENIGHKLSPFRECKVFESNGTETIYWKARCQTCKATAMIFKDAKYGFVIDGKVPLIGCKGHSKDNAESWVNELSDALEQDVVFAVGGSLKIRGEQPDVDANEPDDVKRMKKHKRID